jgi:hypothetical protein
MFDHVALDIQSKNVLLVKIIVDNHASMTVSQIIENIKK